MRTYTNKHKHLLDDPNVKRWYDDYKRGSIITAVGALQRLGRACDLFRTTPAKLAKMNVKQATDFILDLTSKLEEDELQPSTVRHHQKILKSWFKHNDITITRKFKTGQAAKPSKVALEQAPLPEQVRRLLNAADHKEKCEIALIALAGLRLESMGNYLGKDGLKIKDLPELVIDNKSKTAEFTTVPAMVTVRANLSKSKRQYFTFLPSEGCQYLTEFLEHRMLNGEELTPDSPVITSLHFHKQSLEHDSIGHITTRKIGQSIKRVITASKYDYRPYILRSYFANRLLMAETEGLIVRDFRVFNMGHVGDIEATYTMNKGKLPEDMVAKMRDMFSKAAERHLTTIKSRDVNEDVTARFNRQFLLMSGLSEEDVDNLGDLAAFKPDELRQIVKEHTKESMGLKNGNSQKVVAIEEVEGLLNAGWQWVAELPNGKAIVKLPSS